MEIRKYFFLLLFLLLSGALLLPGKEKNMEKRTNLALHCDVYSHTGRNPEYAVDGVRSGAFFESRFSPENYLEIDLGTVKKVDGVRIFFWYGDTRYYQFYVVGSLDGKKWEILYDGKKNRVRSGKEGFGKDFSPRKLRYIRTFVTYNSVNAASHIREVEVYGCGS